MCTITDSIIYDTVTNMTHNKYMFLSLLYSRIFAQ